MRLPQVRTYRLKELIGEAIPPYATLSHTWLEEDFLMDPLKIQKGHEEARSDEHKWIWVDTCCIAKTYSAEIWEAVNSMYDF
ncbi:uncharacterized protein BCR38DRAFT_334683 [Pseudomassariella vexata]|uniref:Heterokaryon incompatibility domain-containing protein n=1 Tax=Pseudomassariella vexata TaxID=1141098 RepID=A0A1Y2EC58_9PEZI|nr:uncharacterized protein BCR38DRAFT_334683 [Pseudomassariella vexata]ORY68884.1 hypothetical protein BCR38DRAFT_334683 [Pseudomassariella vexata]